jgi:hypothetical protein
MLNGAFTILNGWFTGIISPVLKFFGNFLARKLRCFDLGCVLLEMK